MSTTKPTHLTRYPAGSIRELCAISWPIVLSSAAGYLMAVIDRLFLSHYSEAAFNACFAATQWYWNFFCTTAEIVLIAEVFVGQLNGAKRFREIGPAVWQMIWFCLLLYSIFIPISIWGAPLLVADNVAELGVPYLRILTLFIPIDCIGYCALGAFFVGRGETKIIPRVTIVANLLNVILDIPFIFGLQWGDTVLIPAGGVVGAAIATVVSQSLSALLLFGLFIRKSYRDRYGTNRIALKPQFLGHCLKIGMPASLARFINSLGWAILTQVIAANVSTDDFQAYGISHSIYILFMFFNEGFSVGTRTICSNAMGAHQYHVVRRNCHAWVSLILIVMGITAIGMIFFPEPLIRSFLTQSDTALEITHTSAMLRWAWIAFALEFTFMNMMSMLIASGDTRFTMFVNTASFLCLSVVPTYIGIVYFGMTSILFWYSTLLDGSVRSLLFFRRYRSGRWMRHRII